MFAAGIRAANLQCCLKLQARTYNPAQSSQNSSSMAAASKRSRRVPPLKGQR
jgi:hypothetical protein